MSISIHRLPSEGSLSLGDKIVNTANEYLNLSGRKVLVLNQSMDHGACPALQVQEKTHWAVIALKVASYFTLILPLIAFIVSKIGNSAYQPEILNAPSEDPNAPVLSVNTDKGEIKVPWNARGCLGSAQSVQILENNRYEIDLTGKREETILKLMHFQRQKQSRKMNLSKALECMAVARELGLNEWMDQIEKALKQWSLGVKKDLRAQTNSDGLNALFEQLQDPRLQKDEKILTLIQNFLSREIAKACEANDSSLVSFLAERLKNESFQIDLKFDVEQTMLSPICLMNLPHHLIRRMILGSSKSEPLIKALDELAEVQAAGGAEGSLFRELWLETTMKNLEMMKLLDHLPGNLEKFVKAPVRCCSDIKQIQSLKNQSRVIFWKGMEAIELQKQRYKNSMRFEDVESRTFTAAQASDDPAHLIDTLKLAFECDQADRIRVITYRFRSEDYTPDHECAFYHLKEGLAMRVKGSFCEAVSYEEAKEDLIAQIEKANESPSPLDIRVKNQWFS